MIDPREFEPLPYYSWEERPASVPLTIEEAASAIFVARGDLKRAAELLKVQLPQLSRPRETVLSAAPNPSGGAMTHEQRTERIRILTRELASLLEEEGGAPKPIVKVLTAADSPSWVAQGLIAAIRRKCAEGAPTAH